jgi:hypothetical protein
VPTIFTPPFYLIHQDGKTWEFETLSALREGLWSFGCFKPPSYRHLFTKYPEFQTTNIVGWKHVTRDQTDDTVVRCDWIVRDSIGKPVSATEVWDEDKKTKTLTRWERRELAKSHAAKLGLPIPGTGNRPLRYHGYRMMTGHMTETRSISAFLADRREDPDFIELASHLNGLGNWDRAPPDPWDDLPRGRQPYRSWKSYKKSRRSIIGRLRRGEVG